MKRRLVILAVVSLAALFGTGSAADAAELQPRAQMLVGRDNAIAVVLSDGRVLVAGGRTSSDIGGINAAEVYDPSTDSWSATGSMLSPRGNSPGVRLLDGRVLVVGSGDGNDGRKCEIYDPASGLWTPTADKINWGGGTATLLSDGRVLVVGGFIVGGSTSPNPEIYDVSTNTWSSTPPMAFNRTEGHTATLLLDGRVLCASGFTGVGINRSLVNNAELYDPSSNVWSVAAPGSTVDVGLRSNHAAVLLPDGKVLVLGGFFGDYLDSAVIYDPATDSLTNVPPMPIARSLATATLLSSGRIVVTGGRTRSPEGGSFETIWSTDTLDVSTMTWALGHDLNSVRSNHRAVTLNDGRVLIIGGSNGSTPANPLEFFASTEVYDEAANPPIVGGGRSPSVDGFLAYSGTYVKDRISTIFKCDPTASPNAGGANNTVVVTNPRVVITLTIAGNGETVFPETAHLTLNGVAVALPPLPASGSISIRIRLNERSNEFLGSMDGIKPGTTQTGTDSDRVVIKCNPDPPR